MTKQYRHSRVPKTMHSTRVWPLVLVALSLAAPARAQAGEVAGRVILQGPHRDVTALKISLRYVSALRSSSTQEAQRVSPGPDGRFRFAHVDPGIYVLQADGPGMMSAQWGANGPELAGRALVVHAGESRDGLELPVMARPVLCGRVFGPDGKPMPHASVSAWGTDAEGKSLMQGGGSSNSLATSGGNQAADAEGRFRFDNLQTGLYILGAYLPETQPGVPSQERVDGFWKDAHRTQQATAIDLKATGAPDTCSYDLHLRPLPPLYTGPRYTVDGLLTPGSPMPSVRKLAWSMSPAEDRTYDPHNFFYRPFDPSAPSFHFEGVAPGRYEISLGAPGVQEFSGVCFPFDRVEARQIVTITADTHNIQLQRTPTATLRGEVEERYLQRDPNSTHLHGDRIWVSLTRQGGCTAANTALDGTFTLDDLDTGDYNIHASVPLPEAYMSSVTVNGIAAPDGLLHLVAGENVVRIALNFDAGRIDARIDARRLDGSLALDEHNNWLGGDEQVLLLHEDGTRVETNIAANHGRFTGVLPPGRYIAVAGTNEQLVWAWADERWRDPHLLQAMRVLGTAFEIKPLERTTVQLQDKTIEIQDLTAKLGVVMYSR